jgi:hypothetical protein
VAVALNSVNADSDDKICEWVEMQGHTNCPSTFYELIYVNKSVPTTGDQLTSVDRPGHSSMHVTGQEEEKIGENTAASHPTLLLRCSNGITGAGFSSKFVQPR